MRTLSTKECFPNAKHDILIQQAPNKAEWMEKNIARFRPVPFPCRQVTFVGERWKALRNVTRFRLNPASPPLLCTNRWERATVHIRMQFMRNWWMTRVIDDIHINQHGPTTWGPPNIPLIMQSYSSPLIKSLQCSEPLTWKNSTHYGDASNFSCQPKKKPRNAES